MIYAFGLLLALAIAALIYVYVGYLLALHLLVWLRGPRPIRHSPITPRLTLVVSAFNEAEVIRKKIENALALDYPRELFEVLVVSDASDDGTDQIVAEYASQGVRLFRQEARRGKTAGLNAAVPTITGEIVVFSDANAMYRQDALRMLTRNFADPQVGCVTGEARYLPGDNAAADVGERAYWDYEMQVKRLETALGSMVGGDGAIYAIRRTLWRTLPDNAINDFLNPLQIVAAGWRGVYEPEAVCFEETAGGTRVEYKRRVRIVSRSWRAVFQAREVLNPLKVGIFAWSVISHKVLRWLSGVFASIALLSGLGLYLEGVRRWPIASVAVLLLLVAVVASVGAVRRRAALGGYFVVIIAASVVGLLKGSLGNVSGVWSTPRQQTNLAEHSTYNGPMMMPVRWLLFLLTGLAVLGVGIGYRLNGPIGAAEALFWGSAAMLAYVYAGYPLALLLLRKVARKPVRYAASTPAVCLFITANDEADVIEAKLQNALELDYPADLLDIVVASDGSVDSTNDVVRRFAPRVRLLEFSPRRGKIAVINDGMATVTSAVVVFSDANTFLDAGAVRALVEPFEDASVGAVSGDVRLIGERAALGRSEDLYYRYERWEQQAESEIGSMIGVDGALYAIRRRLFVAPAFDTILDDMAIPMGVVQAGYRVVFNAEARASEQGSASAREEFARKSRVIAGAVQFLARGDSSVPRGAWQVRFSIVSHKALRWLSPIFGAGTFISSLVLSNVSPTYAAAAIAQSTVLVLGVAGCVPLLRRTGAIALAHYFCLVQAAAAIGFLRGLSGRQSVRWQRFVRAQAHPARTQ